ncbi:hypothetical protein [Amycolatopsis thermophila]|uniref:Uncharacterized protein n=1 Tax=Amycolatopsis thermophila TaxID=206084 RepID=A0ABU0F315_9PSEU|nr:hypothetical protein [Amycolatopsis thermophila]MDQ0381427.1 hypothetical protein [Amycolatopsis thermophila]
MAGSVPVSSTIARVAGQHGAWAGDASPAAFAGEAVHGNLVASARLLASRIVIVFGMHPQ